MQHSDVSEMKYYYISRDNREEGTDIGLVSRITNPGHSFSHIELAVYVAYQLSVHNNHSSS